MESVVMRVTPAVAETVKEWARPLETRPQVLGRMVRLATEGPPEEWLVRMLTTFFDEQRGDWEWLPDCEGVAQYVLSKWGELRELALEERLGPDPEVIIAGESVPKEVTP